MALILPALPIQRSVSVLQWDPGSSWSVRGKAREEAPVLRKSLFLQFPHNRFLKRAGKALFAGGTACSERFARNSESTESFSI